MLRGDRSNQAFNIFFVPIGTVDISPAFSTPGKRGFLPRPVGTPEFSPEQDSTVPTGRVFYRRFFPAVNCRANVKPSLPGRKQGQAQCLFL